MWLMGLLFSDVISVSIIQILEFCIMIKMMRIMADGLVTFSQ